MVVEKIGVRKLDYLVEHMVECAIGELYDTVSMRDGLANVTNLDTAGSLPPSEPTQIMTSWSAELLGRA